MKDRLDYPVEFLEEMIKNFSGALADRTEAYQLTSSLIDVVRRSDSVGIQEWLDSISFDPEYLGTAFCVVHQFAVAYKKKLDSMGNQGQQPTT